MNLKINIEKVEQTVEHTFADGGRELRKHIDEYGAEHRSGLVRAGALFLATVVAISTIEFGHGNDDRRNLNRSAREAVVARTVVFDPAEKNETVREPVKLDDGVRATATAAA